MMTWLIVLAHRIHPTPLARIPPRIHLTFFLDLHLYAVIWTFYKIFIDIVVQFWLIASHSPLFYFFITTDFCWSADEVAGFFYYTMTVFSCVLRYIE